MRFKWHDPHGYKKKFAFLPTLVESYDNSFHKIWIWWEWYETSDRYLFGGGYETNRRSLNPENTMRKCRGY